MVKRVRLLLALWFAVQGTGVPCHAESAPSPLTHGSLFSQAALANVALPYPQSMEPKYSAALWQKTRRAALKALGIGGFFAAAGLLFAQAEVINPQNDLLALSSAVLAAGVNQDTQQQSLLQRLSTAIAVVIRDAVPIPPDARAQTLNNLVATVELLMPVTSRRYDAILIALANTLDITLYPRFWDDLPAGEYDALLARLHRVATASAVYPAGSGVMTALTHLIEDIVSRKPRVPAPRALSDVPSNPGRFNPRPSIFLDDADLKNARRRLVAGDAWTLRQQRTLSQQAAAAPALAAIPEVMTYKPDTSDELAQQGIALATLWRLDGADADRVARAKKILFSFINGFHAGEPALTANDGLDLSVSIPSFAYLFELLAPALTPEEGNAVVAKFSLMAERIQQTAYGAGVSDRTLRNARLLSNHRTWQDAAAYIAALASGRQDVADWALGSTDPGTRDGGLRFHLRESYGPDDLILEGPSFGYQLYDGTALALAARAAQASGARAALAGYRDGRLRRIFLAVIRYARADLTTPVNGDSGWVDLHQQTSLYALVSLLYKGDPAFLWVMAQERPVSFRAQTVLADALQIWATAGNGAVPDPAPAAANQQGILEFRQNPSLLHPGSCTIFFTPRHTVSHQIANNLAIEAALNAVTLSADYHPGSSAYAKEEMNARYWRGRAANIMELNGAVPLGSASFDENGAQSRLTYAIEQPGAGVTAHVGFGDMTGGYVKNGTDHADRAFIQVDGTDDQPSYRLIDSRLQASSSAQPQRAGAIWHGPRAATATQTSLTFAPTARPAAEEPTFLYMDQGSARLQKTGPVTGAWSVTWMASDGETKLQLNALPAAGATQVTLGVGPENAPFLYLENSFEASAPVHFQSTLVLQDLPASVQAAQVAPLSSNAAAVGAIVQSAAVRDWAVISHVAGIAVDVDNPADASERMIVAGHYGVARIRNGRIDMVGDVAAFALRAPNAGAVRVTLNGVDVLARSIRRDGTLILWQRGPRAAPARPRLAALQYPMSDFKSVCNQAEYASVSS